jgi:divalent metal cation (Fe/Co/Zn/Cd) transporter
MDGGGSTAARRQLSGAVTTASGRPRPLTTVVEGGLHHLRGHQRPAEVSGTADVAPVGIALSVLSLVVVPILAYAKQRTGKQMGSRALLADSKETWVCSNVSLALLIGVGSYVLFGWWWADSVGTLVMLPVIIWQGWETLTEACEHESDTD